MRAFAKKTERGLEIRVKVHPRSAKSEIVGEFDGMLRVRLNAPPVDGAANKELIKLFSKYFGVAKTDISIVSGEKSRHKLLFVASGTPSNLIRMIEDIGTG